MAITPRNHVVFERYTRQDPPVDVKVQTLIRYLFDELGKLETAVNDLSESCPQVADRAPQKPRIGMQRYAIAPWNPGSGSDKWYHWNGTAWTLL